MLKMWGEDMLTVLCKSLTNLPTEVEVEGGRLRKVLANFGASVEHTAARDTMTSSLPRLLSMFQTQSANSAGNGIGGTKPVKLRLFL